MGEVGYLALQAIVCLLVTTDLIAKDSNKARHRWGIDTPSIEPVECLLVSGILIESSRRPLRNPS